ncbi:TRAP transporter large permease subunit [Paracoccus sp. S3-43]|uniref:TRAP transporter large permease subunit n=1 Tax=Paracoccus sp. S3-43 TaxID=3030011 RepID=UPI0031843BDD
MRRRPAPACGKAGVMIGVVTLTRVGFKIAFMVTSVAAGWVVSVHGLLAGLSFELFSIETPTLLFTLLMTAVVCVLMGCGVPTTANYIIMVAVLPIGAAALVIAVLPLIRKSPRRDLRRGAIRRTRPSGRVRHSSFPSILNPTRIRIR